jgi:adenylosuccinate lyase
LKKMIERYTRREMGRIWEEKNKFQIWLEIEILACEALAELGKIPRDAVEEIRRKAGFDIARIAQIESEVQHDVIAFLTSVKEKVGEAAKYIHLGLTSSDILDTALSVQLRQAADLLIADVERVIEILRRKAAEHKYTVMIGRTHGVHAEPTTFGLKMALWSEEMKRNLARLKGARDIISVGKISGAVGTYANIDPFVEEYVCEKLGLQRAPVSTQIVQRDRHAEFLCALAICAASLDKFATEIRGLQKTEVREVEEPFGEKQKGSSAMPHKRNPVVCERISGIARIIRGNAMAGIENIPLWHERDISHSSVERVILPDSTIALDYILHKFAWIMENLLIYPENMQRNLEKTKGLIFSQRVLLALINKGMMREDAYRIVQDRAMEAWRKDSDFRELIKGDSRVKELLTEEEIAGCFQSDYHLRNIEVIFQRLGL